MSEPSEKLADFPLGEKYDAQCLFARGKGRITAEAEGTHGLWISVHTDFLHLNLREFRQNFLQRQTCRFAAASEI